MVKLTENLCTTKWTINGHVKKTFAKKMNEPNFLAWYYLNKVKCVSSDVIAIDKIEYPYFIGLNNKDIKEYKKEYKKYKNILFYKHDKKSKGVFIFTDKEYFNKFLFLRNYIQDEKNINKILKNKEINEIIKKIKFKNKGNKQNFIYTILTYIIRKYSYKNIKIMIKKDYYKYNFLSEKNKNKYMSYYELYNDMKKKRIEEVFNKSINILYKNLKKIIFDIK
tara:strand:+ start:11 stop:676 length:666 start_codon:yes stop_codon:yes gene_type:complete